MLGVMPDGLFSPVHWIVIALVALVVLGPQDAARAMRALGKGWRRLQEFSERPLDHLLELPGEDAPAEGAPGEPGATTTGTTGETTTPVMTETTTKEQA